MQTPRLFEDRNVLERLAKELDETIPSGEAVEVDLSHEELAALLRFWGINQGT